MRKSIPYIIIAVLVIIIYFQNCRGGKTVKEVTVPEVSGSITATDSIIHDTVTAYLPGKVVKSKKDSIALVEAQQEIKRVQDEYTKLDSAFAASNDKKFQQKLFRDAAKPKSFKQTFKDTLIEGTMSGLVSNGMVQGKIRFDYKLKERKVKEAQKEVYLRVLTGGELGVNKELNQGAWKVNLSIQDKHNNLYTGSFQKIGGQEYYLAGFQKAIFSFKH